MNEYGLHFAALLFGVLIASLSQILLKRAANRSYPSFIRQLLNRRVLFAYGLLLLSTVFSLFALRLLPLGLTPAAEAAGQLFTALFGCLFLKEKINLKKAAGLLMIAAGMLLIAL